MIRRAEARLLNRWSFKHSSRNPPLKLPPQLPVQTVVNPIRQQHQQQAFAMRHEVVPADVEALLPRSPFTEREQAAQSAVASPVHGVDQDGQTIAQVEAAADDEADAHFGRSSMRTGDAGQRVVVGDRQRRVAECLCSDEQLLDVAGTAQERVVRGGPGARRSRVTAAAHSSLGWRCVLVVGATAGGRRMMIMWNKPSSDGLKGLGLEIMATWPEC